MKNTQAGIALVHVLIIGAVVVGGAYYLSDKVNLTTKSIAILQKDQMSSYSMKGVVAYAKDLVASRVCLNAAENTGLPTSTCKLTDNGSLERLIISTNINQALCRFYVNNGKPQDGLQNFCEPGRPPLYLANYSFQIKSANITRQHPLFNLFDEASGYSIGAKCIKVTYKSSISNLHSTFATIETTAQAYKDAACSKDLISQAGSTDVFFPRPINGFTLVSNRSLSVGNTGAEADINLLRDADNIIFNSPVFINKNLYLPNSGSGDSRKVVFRDKVYYGGDLKSTDNNVLSPVLVDNGNLWMSRYPHYYGITKGLYRNESEQSLYRMFHPNLSPDNDGLLMQECNDYRNRKSDSKYCIRENPRLIAKQLTSTNYLLGMSKLSEFIPYDIKDVSDNGWVTYSTGKIPASAQVQLTYGSNIYLSAGTDAAMDLMKFGVLEFANGKSCIELASPVRKICLSNNNLTIKTLSFNPTSTVTKTIPADDKKEELAGFSVDDKKYTQISYANCRMSSVPVEEEESSPGNSGNSNSGGNSGSGSGSGTGGDSEEVCDETTKTFDVTEAPYDGPKLVFKPTPRFTDKGTVAPQLLQLEIQLSAAIDPGIFKIKTRNVVFDAKPFDFCAKLQSSYYLEVIVTNTRVDFKPISTLNWVDLGGQALSLSQAELNYLQGRECFHDKCSNMSAPSTSYASYDADWSKEAFNSWNYNPVDKTNMYRPGSGRMDQYYEIFDVNKPAANRVVFKAIDQAKFYSYGIIDQCIVDSSVDYVKGFFVCRYLHISARSKDLEMIGTFVVDKLKIESLGGSKITWSNIYHPSVRKRLEDTNKNNGIAPQTSCAPTYDQPTWARISNECDPSYLVMKSAPHSWTTFDPLCVIITGSAVPICKPEDRAYNLEMIKIYDYFGN